MFKKRFFRIALIGLLFLGSTMTQSTVQAQCPMCKMSAEQNLKDGGKAGKGLNAGILYMFALPYTIVMCMGIWWYRNRKKDESTDLAEAVINDVNRLN